MKRGGTSQKREALNFAYENWSSDCTATIMRNFKIRPAAFLSSFRLRPIVAWKIYLQQWMLPDVQPKFLQEGWTKSNCFLPQNCVI